MLAYSTVTNTGPSVLNGDIGLSPGTAVTGFPPGLVNGGVHITDAVAAQALVDTQAAYTNAANQTLDRITVPVDLVGTTLVAGLYESTGAGALANSGTVTLDGQGVTTGVWVFQSSSTLITAAGSTVEFINGANPCNVYWQVASSATLGSNSAFIGTIMASDTITTQTGATVVGRLLALNGAVNLDSTTITSSGCTPTTPSGPLPPGYSEADFTTGVGPGGETPGTPGAETPGAGTPGTDITVDVPSLPATGVDPAAPLLAAVVLVTLGTALLFHARRRRTVLGATIAGGRP